jgi:hypothetical protein
MVVLRSCGRLADDHFRECRIDGQNISGVTCPWLDFRILLETNLSRGILNHAYACH